MLELLLLASLDPAFAAGQGCPPFGCNNGPLLTGAELPASEGWTITLRGPVCPGWGCENGPLLTGLRW